jgi:hypothetical protein
LRSNIGRGFAQKSHNGTTSDWGQGDDVCVETGFTAFSRALAVSGGEPLCVSFAGLVLFCSASALRAA